jgi:hypothetical protein
MPTTSPNPKCLTCPCLGVAHLVLQMLHLLLQLLRLGQIKLRIVVKVKVFFRVELFRRDI